MKGWKWSQNEEENRGRGSATKTWKETEWQREIEWHKDRVTRKTECKKTK